jgi:hypothetical protein
MQTCVFVDDSNDEQAATLHETGTREPRPRLPNVSFVSRAFTTDAVRRGVARLRRSCVPSFPFSIRSLLSLLTLSPQ